MQFLVLIFVLSNQPASIRNTPHTTHTGEICPGATYFYSGNVKPYWTKTLEFKCKIGDHYFYGKKEHGRKNK